MLNASGLGKQDQRRHLGLVHPEIRAVTPGYHRLDFS